MKHSQSMWVGRKEVKKLQVTPLQSNRCREVTETPLKCYLQGQSSVHKRDPGITKGFCQEMAALLQQRNHPPEAGALEARTGDNVQSCPCTELLCRPSSSTVWGSAPQASRVIGTETIFHILGSPLCHTLSQRHHMHHLS